jgi:hypothetical protein
LFGKSGMFSAWMIGFLLLMATLVWVAVVLGLPQPYIGLAVLGLLVAALGVAVAVIRQRRPPRR